MLSTTGSYSRLVVSLLRRYGTTMEHSTLLRTMLTASFVHSLIVKVTNTNGAKDLIHLINDHSWSRPRMSREIGASQSILTRLVSIRIYFSMMMAPFIFPQRCLKMDQWVEIAQFGSQRSTWATVIRWRNQRWFMRPTCHSRSDGQRARTSIKLMALTTWQSRKVSHMLDCISTLHTDVLANRRYRGFAPWNYPP